MNGFTNSILSLLLSWIRLLIGQIWAALNSENGSRALSFLQSNWKFLVVCLAVGGFVADRLVYFLRWRPDTVWRNRRKARRSQRRQDFSHEYVPTVENRQPVSPAQHQHIAVLQMDNTAELAVLQGKVDTALVHVNSVLVHGNPGFWQDTVVTPLG